jgi:hypothetical protein
MTGGIKEILRRLRRWPATILDPAGHAAPLAMVAGTREWRLPPNKGIWL